MSEVLDGSSTLLIGVVVHPHDQPHIQFASRSMDGAWRSWGLAGGLGGGHGGGAGMTLLVHTFVGLSKRLQEMSTGNASTAAATWATIGAARMPNHVSGPMERPLAQR